MGRKIGIAVMVFYMLLGLAFFVYGAVKGDVSVPLFQVYLGTLTGVYGIFAGTDSFIKRSKGKYYRPEMDDAHPAAQKAAVKKLESSGEKRK